jgi:hypothetical protein
MRLGVGFKVAKLVLIYITFWPPHLARTLAFISVPLTPPQSLFSQVTTRFLLAFWKRKRKKGGRVPLQFGLALEGHCSLKSKIHSKS